MSWYYPETRPRRVPLTTPVRPAASGGGGGPPTGPAGGDLAGTYPNPTLAPGAVGTTDLVDGAVTDAKITSVAYSKVTGAPTSLPPSGAASGSLGGSYPGPSIAASAVRGTPSSGGTAREIAKASIWGGDDLIDLSVPDAKISGLAYTKVSGAPTALPPSGAAGGDLAGTYPNPTIGPLKVTTGSIAALAVTDAKINDVAYSKVTGHPTSYPPNGAAAGDLGGTYPGPTIAKLNGAAVGTTTPLARGDILVANATPALVRLARGTVNQVLQSDGTDVVWGPAPATGGPPTGAAGGSLAGSYPNPTVAASAIRGTPSAGGTAREIQKASIWGGDDLIDLSVPDAKIAAVAYGKVTGHPTSYPPSGPAGGDLAGTYPNPTHLAIAARVRLSGTVPTIPNNTNTLVSFDVADLNRGSCWASGQPTRVLLPTPGIYLVIGGVTWNNTSTAGGRNIELVNKAGTGYARADVLPMSGWQRQDTSMLYVASDPTDYIMLQVFQNSGGGLGFAQASGDVNACLQVWRLAT